MRINLQSDFTQMKTQAKQPTFKSIQLVKVKKNVFTTPDDLEIVSKTFDGIVNELERTHKKQLKLFLIENKLMDYKLCTFLEQPMYLDFVKELADNNLSLPWLKRIIEDSGLSVQGPLDQNYHSFYVCSGQNKEAAKEYINKSNWKRLHKIAAKQEMKFASKNDEEPNYRRAFARLNQLLVKTLQDEIIGETPVRNIIIDDEKDLPLIWDYFA